MRGLAKKSEGGSKFWLDNFPKMCMIVRVFWNKGLNEFENGERVRTGDVGITVAGFGGIAGGGLAAVRGSVPAVEKVQRDAASVGRASGAD